MASKSLMNVFAIGVKLAILALIKLIKKGEKEKTKIKGHVYRTSGNIQCSNYSVQVQNMCPWVFHRIY